jgi:hypothetical protein
VNKIQPNKQYWVTQPDKESEHWVKLHVHKRNSNGILVTFEGPDNLTPHLRYPDATEFDQDLQKGKLTEVRK